jgi:hypothetical protein
LGGAPGGHGPFVVENNNIIGGGDGALKVSRSGT